MKEEKQRKVKPLTNNKIQTMRKKEYIFQLFIFLSLLSLNFVKRFIDEIKKETQKRICT